jgi:hypothetical protein
MGRQPEDLYVGRAVVFVYTFITTRSDDILDDQKWLPSGRVGPTLSRHPHHMTRMCDEILAMDETDEQLAHHMLEQLHDLLPAIGAAIGNVSMSDRWAAAGVVPQVPAWAAASTQMPFRLAFAPRRRWT